MPRGGSQAAAELAQPAEPEAEDCPASVAPDLSIFTENCKWKSDPNLNTITHPVGTVISNLPVSAELPKQFRQPSALWPRKLQSSMRPVTGPYFQRELPCFAGGLFLAAGESGKKMIEVWKLTNGCFVQRGNKLGYTSGTRQMIRLHYVAGQCSRCLWVELKYLDALAHTPTCPMIQMC